MSGVGDETPAERVSRFREHTNTNSSIRAPPDELWKDFGTELLLDKYGEDNDSTPAVRRNKHPRHIMDRQTTMEPPTPAQQLAISQRPIATPKSRKQSDAAATVATAEGTFGRFSRVFASVFSGVLGKRKASADEPSSSNGTDSTSSTAHGLAPDQALLDARKQAAEEAYHLAKAQGLLPAPKVFVRPAMASRAYSADNAAGNPCTTPSRSPRSTRAPRYPKTTPTLYQDPDPTSTGTPRAFATPSTTTARPRPPLTPRTPGSVVRSPSARDLRTQKRLSKRVSSLEVKLASAKKELASVLGTDGCFPAVPPVPAQFAAAAAAGRDGRAEAEAEAEAEGEEGLDGEPHSSSPRANNPMPMLMSDDAPLSPSDHLTLTTTATAPLPNKLTKRRKLKSVPVDQRDADAAFASPPNNKNNNDTAPSNPPPDPQSEHASQSQSTLARSTSRLKRTSSRLHRKVSRSSVRSGREQSEQSEERERVVVVRPGGEVPPVPALPSGVEGKKVSVEGDDGYGGLGHEIF